ncbi:hypothetical protein [Polaromonas sp. YR568]|uniref:hypothetical protein n=1 Tax=Polaromonas sp. YR568 TaxID=1855301 RepID=UPI0031383D0B
MPTIPTWLESARAQWNWRGQSLPPFAIAPGPGQVSVWDFPGRHGWCPTHAKW